LRSPSRAAFDWRIFAARCRGRGANPDEHFTILINGQPLRLDELGFEIVERTSRSRPYNPLNFLGISPIGYPGLKNNRNRTNGFHRGAECAVEEIVIEIKLPFECPIGHTPAALEYGKNLVEHFIEIHLDSPYQAVASLT
jgi:hypothetical protein